MHLLYFDEVKYDPPVQSSFWMGGVCVHHEHVPALEERVNDLSLKAFGDRRLSRETEFHGFELCRGKGNFKGRDWGERLGILKELLDILTDEKVGRIRIRINPQNIVYSPKDPSEIAFMYLIEQADAYFREKETLGMLFGDYDEPAVGPSVTSLSKYRRGGTEWAAGRDIENIIDTVHFARSHHSRMIQLADVFLYCCQFTLQNNESHWRKAIADIIQQSGIYACHKSRNWPVTTNWQP
ncbi:DUF3800 domain-containing protein [Pelagibacterium nitratireducens]|uniref:DUF3800 domain-containing protein n=1 Tax=Pelagibacterium nitratireducens TaxID=1046114 RepID=A0ABZ2HXR6_9HYPH